MRGGGARPGSGQGKVGSVPRRGGVGSGAGEMDSAADKKRERAGGGALPPLTSRPREGAGLREGAVARERAGRAPPCGEGRTVLQAVAPCGTPLSAARRIQ